MRRYGRPKTDEERRATHRVIYGTEELPPRGTGLKSGELVNEPNEYYVYFEDTDNPANVITVRAYTIGEAEGKAKLLYPNKKIFNIVKKLKEIV